MRSLSGSCLCGAVAYDVTRPFDEMHHCHCSRCRKAHGAAFSTFARTAAASAAPAGPEYQPDEGDS